MPQAPFAADSGAGDGRSGASAGGMVAVVLANIVAFFLIRSVAKQLDA